MNKIEYKSIVLLECLIEHFEFLDDDINEKKKYPVKDLISRDFEDFEYKIVTSGDFHEVLSISVRVSEIMDDFIVRHEEFRIIDYLKSVFRNFFVELSIRGYFCTIQFDTSLLDYSDREKLLKELPVIKYHIFAPIFYSTFDSYLKGEEVLPVTIPYRKHESIYIQKNERVLSVVFTVRFSEKEDYILGNKFIKEMVKATGGSKIYVNEARFAPCIGRYKQKPEFLKTELREMKTNDDLKDYLFVVFTPFERHMNSERRFELVRSFLVFRQYLNYHVMCSKARMDLTMRNRVDSLLKTYSSGFSNLE